MIPVGRRAAAGFTGVVAAFVVAVAPSATADPAPNCTAADLAGIAAGATASTSTYLFTHPDVNAFFTGLKGKPRDQMTTEIQAYMDANPMIRDEIKAVRQPAADFRARCDAPLPDGPMG